MVNLIGKVLLNRFRVDAFIASGGMGMVYRVWDIERKVPLAMKVLRMDLVDDPSVIKLFQREARALEKLAHPHIVQFYGLYQTPDFIFLLVRFVDGLSLKHVLRQRQGKPLPVQEALIYLKALTTSLGYAHANDVVHCDVKPGNVMVDRGGNIFLTDFGIARHAESTTTTIGAAGAPAYMAPEQIRGEPVTPETDIYSLGIVLFELLTGRRPFLGVETGSDGSTSTTGERVRFEHLRMAPPDPREFNPEIPEALASIMMRALEKEPRARYQSTEEFLEAVCDAVGMTPEAIPDRVAPMEMPEEEPMPIVPSTTKRRLPVWAFVTAGIIGLLLIIAFGMVLTSAGVSIISRLFASSTPTLTPTFTPTVTATHTTTLTPSLSPTATFTFTPTAIKVIMPKAFLPTPTTQLLPMYTSTISSSTRFTITICNKWLDGYVFKDGNLANRNLIARGGCVNVSAGPGSHSFKICKSPKGTNCSEKTINVTSDTTINIP